MPLTPVAELQELMRERIARYRRLPESETVAVARAVGRVLAQDVLAPACLPHADLSAMDGYALPEAAAAGSVWKVAGESAAGHPFTGSLNEGECIRIMTGAVVPPCCRTVLVQEHTEYADGCITLTHGVADRANIRYRGEEIAAGSRVLNKGRIVREADVLLLAALGLGEVSVYRKIKVAVLSTGDELCEVGTPAPSEGCIYDSNRPMLMARLAQFPIELVDLKQVSDNLEEVLHVLDDAAQNHDAVITSGGVSVGDYDYMREAVIRLGAIHHYQVAMKPGKPFVFGQMLQAWYFGLPGNPISGFVGFDVFLKNALWQLCGAEELPEPLRFTATLACDIRKSGGRTEFQRALIRMDEAGNWLAEPCGAQDSHRIYGISRANAYLILPADSPSLPAGSRVTVQPFDGAFL